MNPPISYYGGKTTIAKWIISIIARYQFTSYIEPFGGSGAILFAKEPSKVEVYNDIYTDVVNMYRVIRNKRTLNIFTFLVDCVPYSRKFFKECRDRLFNDFTMNNIERAAMFYIVCRQSYGAIMREQNGLAWSYSKTKGTQTRRYFNGIEGLDDICNRLKHVQIENLDAIDCINKYNFANSNTDCSLIYCDPPYLMNTRSKKTAPKYAHEIDDAYHTNLIKTLLNTKGHKLLSAYDHELYNELLDNGWTKETLNTTVRITRNQDKPALQRTECLFCSPALNQ